MMGMVSVMSEAEVFERSTALHRPMFGYARGILLNRQDAEDAVQETYVTILQKYPQLRDETKFRWWVFSILRSKIMERLRERKRGKKEVRVDESVLLTFPNADPDPEQHALRLRLLDQAMASLASDEREIVLKDLAGFLSPEIADQTTMSPSTIRSKLARAKQKMKAFIDGKEGPNPYAGK